MYNFLPHTISTYWYSRPNNTMSSSWNDKRVSGEKTLLNELKKLNLEHLFLARIVLPDILKAYQKQILKLLLI
ncbi:hypothetical protein TS60_0125, partial [Mycoplasma mycoides subsp. mycoides]